MMFHDSSNFAIATNSTIAFNFDEIYARNSSNFQITVNEVYANTRSGIDIGTGSSNFVISATTMCTTQRLRRCVMCSECTNVYASLAILSSTTRKKQASSCICKPQLFRRPGHNTITESGEGIIMLTGYSNNDLCWREKHRHEY
jgi:hypothetical protein